MSFTITESILLTLASILVLVGCYILMKRMTGKFIEKNKSGLVFTVYIIFAMIVTIMVYLEFLFWNTTLVAALGTDWNVIGDFFIEKTGALISSVLLLFIGFGLIRLIKIVLDHSQKSKSVKNTKRRKTIIKLTISLIDYSLKLIIILVVLSIWGVNVFPAIAGLGILGLVIGFGAQDLMKDFIAGFFIIFEKHFDVGDIIEINGFKGEVIDIGLKTTKVMNWKKDIKLFNNASVQNAINYSLSESTAIVEVGIAYHEDIDAVINVLNDELLKLRDNNPDIIDNPQCLGVTNFSSSSIDLRVIVRTATEKQYGVERLLRKEIKKVFDAHNIEIPFTQIVLHHGESEKN